MVETVTVSVHRLGRKRALLSDWSVPLPPVLRDGDGRITLRQFIEHVVGCEVEAFKTRQEERRFVHMLSAAEIDRGVEKGKVDMGGREWRQAVDAEQATATAIQAFEDGLYLVVIDGEQHTELDREIFLKADSRVTFVRLTMLAGG